MGACALTGNQHRDVIVFKRTRVFMLHPSTRVEQNGVFRNLHWGAFLRRLFSPDGHMWTVDQTRKKKDGISKTTTLHVHYTFLYISLLLFHDYDVKIPGFTFYGGRKIFFLFLNLDMVHRNSTPGEFAYIWQSELK